MKQSVYDIVIIGGGMVGASLALSLRQKLPSAMTMAVVEAHELGDRHTGNWQPSYDARSTALSEGTREIFQGLDLWDKLSGYL
ncbi:FAD-dependent oxidoreductase [Sansalvadorimonas sp. 2012CJ34-2]|uniref:FAD-dependent oxidoreductase n=1 Tax=Parendozoicomonas callyspongiae TaxID=2942213 RepID=A0ABT0PIH2_9GAMM|nr:FAD-dependent oxidoreductase [Sansalvadorimonas sp. 2012CJ34-2]MCL6270283.1 FAD-dependent oxidoreductase [Sansalvadorimonas sp. 2012CJ34-2]